MLENIHTPAGVLFLVKPTCKALVVCLVVGDSGVNSRIKFGLGSSIFKINNTLDLFTTDPKSEIFQERNLITSTYYKSFNFINNDKHIIYIII